MTQKEAQWRFSRLLPRLLDKAHELGFEVAVKEVHRPPEMAAIYAVRGTGVSPSIHEMGLAVDLVLWDRMGVYLKQTESYRELGEWWEAQHPDCRWGGRFKRLDGGHFSMKWGALM